jgi:hypothetical protein
MQNAKNRVIESLPSLIQTSKHKVQVVASHWLINFVDWAFNRDYIIMLINI